MKLRFAFLLSLLMGVFAVSHAISFSAVSASVGFTSGTIGSNGLFVQTPSHFLLGAGNRFASITYTVTATPGYRLTSVRLDPNGAVKNGAVNIVSLHPSDATATFTATSTPLIDLGESTTALTSNLSSFNVTTNVILSGLDSTSVSKVSVMQFFYTETAVPEPAAILGLGLGLSLIAIRRKK